MKVYVVTHWELSEYDEIEKIFSSKEKAEKYQTAMRKEHNCPYYYISASNERLYIIEDYSVEEFEVE